MFITSFIIIIIIMALIATLAVTFIVGIEDGLKSVLTTLKTGMLVLFICIAILIINGGVLEVYDAKALDETIKIKQDNIKFEQSQIDIINNQLYSIVQEYVDYEESVLSKDKNMNNIILAGQIYPDLKSNELYISLLDSYQKHNNNIVTGIKDYNNMVGDRKKMSLHPLYGRIIPMSKFNTITNDLNK